MEGIFYCLVKTETMPPLLLRQLHSPLQRSLGSSWRHTNSACTSPSGSSRGKNESRPSFPLLTHAQRSTLEQQYRHLKQSSKLGQLVHSALSALPFLSPPIFPRTFLHISYSSALHVTNTSPSPGYFRKPYIDSWNCMTPQA